MKNKGKLLLMSAIALFGVTAAILPMAISESFISNRQVKAEEKNVSWTAISGDLGTVAPSTGKIKTGDFEWNYTRSLSSGSSFTSFTENCIQLGKNGGVEQIKFETSNIPGIITSVEIECSSYNNAHKFSISVGGTVYKSATSTPKWTTVGKISGSGTSSGNIVIESSGGTRALYIKSITVKYEMASVDTYCISFNNGGGAGSMASVDWSVDKVYTIPEPNGISAPEGKVFDYWSGSNGQSYHKGDSITANTFSKDGSLTLTAVWKDKPTKPSEFVEITIADSNGKVNLPGESDQIDAFKGGTSSGGFDYTLKNLPAGTNKIVVYGAAWNGSDKVANIGDTKATFIADGSISGNSPYNISKDNIYDDSYRMDFSIEPLQAVGDVTISFSGRGVIWFIGYQADSIQSIAIKTNPKISYNAGEKLDPSGLVITATYNNKTEDIAYNSHSSDFSFNPSLNTTLTNQTSVTVTYKEKTTLFNIDVKTLSGLVISSNPSKVSYRAGEKFNPAGIVVQKKLSHSNGSAETSETVSGGLTYSLNGQVITTNTVLSKGSEQVVTVSYTEAGVTKTTTFTINVGDPYVTGITLNKTSVDLGPSSEFALTAEVLPNGANQGYSVELDEQASTLDASFYTFTNGKVTIANEVTTGGVIVLKAITTDVASNGQPISASCTLNVTATKISTIQSVTVSGTPEAATQYVGKTFNYNGLTFTRVFDNNPDEALEITGDKITWSALVAGQHPTGKYTYGQNTVTVIVESVIVEADALASIEISGSLTKTQYYENETAFSSTGLTVSGTMKSGDTVSSISGVTFEFAKKPNEFTVGAQSVTVTAKKDGVTSDPLTCSVTILENALISITAHANNMKVDYILGDVIETAGLTIDAAYTNETKTGITTGFTTNADEVDMLSVGDKTLVVTYEGKTANVIIHVNTKMFESKQQFEKISSIPEEGLVGEYLLVCEDQGRQFNGLLTDDLDSTLNHNSITLNDGIVLKTDDLYAQRLIIEEYDGDLFLKTASGYYLTGKFDKKGELIDDNGMTTSTDKTASYKLNISFDDNGDAIIADGAGPTLRFNYNANDTTQNRFRFYKTTNTTAKKVQLYKYVEKATGTPEVVGMNAASYNGNGDLKVGDKVTVSQFSATLIKNDGSTEAATNLTINGGSEVTLTGTSNTITVSNGTFSKDVVVTAREGTKVTGITVAGSATPMFAGQTQTLTATVAPETADNKAVTWSTSDASVATVNATTGVVTAQEVDGDGKSATITATAADGSGVTGTFVVYVDKDDVNGIQLAESNAMKTSYTYGETFDPSGLVIQEVYESGKLGNTIAYAGHESDFTLGIATDKVLGHDDTSCSVSYGEFDLANSIALTINKKAVSLEVTGYNDSVIEGTDYEIGDGYTATVTYSDGSTGKATLTEVTAADTSTFGTTTVTAKATVGDVELTDTFDVTVEKDVAVDMFIVSGPEKYEYNHNETFNGEGVKITVEFKSGKTETYKHGDAGVSYNLSTLSEVGSKTLEVSYTDKYGTTVYKPVPQSIVVSRVADSLAITGFNNSIYVGQKYEIGAGAVATVTYSDKTTGTIEIPDDLVVDIDNSQVGTAVATVTINGLTAKFNVTVKEDEVDHIQVVSYSGGYTYTHKEAFNPEGLEVTVYYKSGNTEPVYGGDDRLSYSPATFETAGNEITVTVTFTDSQGNTAPANIIQKFTVVKYVDAVTLNSYELYKNYDASGTNTPLGDQDPIYQSDSITAKVVVDVTYSDGSTGQKEGIVSLGGLVQGNNAKAITFEGLEGKQVTLNINGVLGDELTGLTVDTTAMKTDGYIEGQSVDFEGLVITGHYATGAEKEILLSDCTVTGDANLKVGSNEIKLEFDGKEVTFNVNAVAKSVTGIELVGTQAEAYFLESELANIGANGYQIKVTYDNGTTDTIDITNAMVSHENGVVTVTYEGKTDTYEITVLDKSNIASITIENESGTATKDVAYTFNPGTVTAHYEGTNKTLVLDATDYTVDAVAVSEVGDATYDVTLNGTDIKASFTVSVSYADVTGVTISGEVPATIRPNDQVTLTATVAPENANGEVTWSSSDETVATVENGVVTFLKEGTVTITATSVQDPTQKATKELSCEAIHVTDVVIAEEAVEILEGNNATLHVTVNPEDAANPAVTFTSGDETIATVDANGVVTGVKFGTTTITVTSVDGGKTDTVVIVVHVRINGVTITDEVKESYLPKETLQLHATVDCSDPSQGVIWSTSNKLIATVTEDGLVRFFKDGKVVITATSELDPTKSASIELVVHTPYVAMTELQVAQGEASMVVGDELQLNWTIAPVDATDMTLKFVSNNEEVAKVDENGLITAVGPGTTTINISSKDGSLTATCEVTVVAKVTGVSLNETTKTIEEGKSFTLTATVNPENAPNKAVTWETSDASIATVSNGVVTALKAGEVTITVKTNDGNKVASCVVTVTAKPANQGDNGEGGAGVIDNVLNKLGCKGSIAATSALISLATLAGAGLALSKKRKKEDK